MKEDGQNFNKKMEDNQKEKERSKFQSLIKAT